MTGGERRVDVFTFVLYPHSCGGVTAYERATTVRLIITRQGITNLAFTAAVIECKSRERERERASLPTFRLFAPSLGPRGYELFIRRYG